MSRWGKYGPGGQLWAEVQGREHEWYRGDVVDRLLLKVTAPVAKIEEIGILVTIKHEK